MDGFNDAFGTNAHHDEDTDPAAEFLAREQSNLAGLVDDPEVVAPPVVTNGIDVKRGKIALKVVMHINLKPVL